MSQKPRASFEVGAARPDEWPRAFDILFQNLCSAERRDRVANALLMVRRGEFQPGGVLVARDGSELLGAILCLPTPGAGGLIWPPQANVAADKAVVEDRLVRHGCGWLQEQGAKLAQALLAPEEVSMGAPLERNGFRHITMLRYLRHGLQQPVPRSAAEQLVYQSYSAAHRGVFHETLLQTYEDTMDCPEVNGVRSITQIITGHQAQGAYDPEQWWLAFSGDQAVGVLLLAPMGESGGWDVGYLGVVPRFRRRGFGHELVVKALTEARSQQARQLTLSVDSRNLPATKLYRNLGFEGYGEREVYLALWH